MNINYSGLSSKQISDTSEHPENYVLKISKEADGSGKRTIVIQQKNLLSFLERYFYSGNFTYDLSQVKDALERENQTNPGSQPLQSCIKIYNNDVEEYQRSWWTKLIGKDPKISLLTNKINQIASEILKTNKTPSTSKTSSFPIDSPQNNPLRTANSEKLLTPPNSSPPAASMPPKQAAALPPIPQDGIKVGLPNVTDTGAFGNTCWLNSILKFICAGNEFDDMLNTRPPAGQEDLHAQFVTLFNIMRKGETADGRKVEQVPVDVYKNFLTILKESIPEYRDAIGAQQDASEFLLRFGAALDWKPASSSKEIAEQMNKSRNFPRMAREYTPTGSTPNEKTKSCTQDSSLPFLSIKLTADYIGNQTLLDLDALLSTPQTFEGLVPDNPIKIPETGPGAKPGAQKNETYDYLARPHLTCLPQTFIIYLDRLVMPEGLMQWPEAMANPHLYQQKVSNPIKTTGDNLITFVEYAPTYDTQGKVSKLTPHKKCHYRIDAAINHEGGAQFGHYVCQERSASGKLTRHSDTDLRPITDKSQFGIDGNLLRLTMVKEEMIPDSDSPTSLKPIKAPLSSGNLEQSSKSPLKS